MRLAPFLDFLEVNTDPPDDFFPIAVIELLPKFIEGKMDDVVVMNLFGGNIVTEFKPNAVQEVDFLGCKARSMGTEIKNMFLPAREENLQSQLRFGVR